MTDDERRTMKEIDHTHPYDDRSAGALFARGPVVVADGGERNAAPRSDATPEPGESEPTETMRDVDHTPPNGEEGANRVFERGEEFDEDGTVVEE